MAYKLISRYYKKLSQQSRMQWRTSMYKRYCFNSQSYRDYSSAFLQNESPLPELSVPVQLAGRKYLPGSWHHQFPQQLNNPQPDFPHVVTPSNTTDAANLSLTDWATVVRQYLDDNLTKYGAVLVRSLPIQNETHFSQLVSQLKYNPQSYKGGIGNRHSKVTNVMTASDEPKECSIELHNEMAYSPNWSDLIIFYCKIPPALGHGGHTCIAKVSDYVDRLGQDITQPFLKRGLRYQNYLFSQGSVPYKYITWQQSFQTKEKAEVEEFCTNAGYTYKWDDNENLTYYIDLPAVVNHSKTSKLSWFNQIYQHSSTYTREHPSFEVADLPLDKHPLQCYFGDGGEISEDILFYMRSVNWQVAVGFEWQAGDVLFLDNVLVQHSRLSFEGPRKVYVSIMNY
ncbi:Dapdiamide synthesis protein DdaC [Trichoplax sp. H2]|nr:Dapdiamide synthesis protein DdaC [Trichoplax sp. H2]|eukprot:RDD39684.1 Dapdiamide synthesis protein DdaC [Trichoplax sp. H2]